MATAAAADEARRRAIHLEGVMPGVVIVKQPGAHRHRMGVGLVLAEVAGGGGGGDQVHVQVDEA